ncbi:MAG: leucine-rich repeat domain-containing protein, partial [Bacteroidota bacterium]
MIRILALISVLWIGNVVQAQDTTAVDSSMAPSFLSSDFEAGPVLNSIQLERQKWFTSMDEAMRRPEEVYKLSLSRDKLKAFPYDISRFKNLQVLNLSYNKIKEVPSEIAELPNLQTIILTNNKIRSLPDQMSELNNLEVLYLGQTIVAEI